MTDPQIELAKLRQQEEYIHKKIAEAIEEYDRKQKQNTTYGRDAKMPSKESMAKLAEIKLATMSLQDVVETVSDETKTPIDKLVGRVRE